MKPLKNDIFVMKRTSAATIDEAEKIKQQEMISEAAFYKAQKRDFASGHEIDDWLEAEKEIVNKLKST
jgi:hypothetical protein